LASTFGYGDRNRVERSHVIAGNPLALEQLVHRAQPVALPSRVLVPLLGGGLAHLELQPPFDLLVTPGQELDHAVN
jgi:hypothetical protein